MKLRRHLGAAAEDPGDAKFLKRNLLAECFQKLRRGKEATDVVVRAQQSQPLIDYVLLVLFCHFGLAHFKQLDHPTGIKIYHEADAPAILSQVFDCQPQTTRSSRTKR